LPRGRAGESEGLDGHGVKVKNPNAPAVKREAEEDWGSPHWIRSKSRTRRRKPCGSSALAWQYYGDQATDMIKAWALPGATSKPTAPPEGFAELQQQLKSITADLAAVRHTLEQQSAANHDQLTRFQEQIAQQSVALQATKQELSQKLSPSPPADKPVHTPLPKPAQHPAHLSTPESSKPIQVLPPQSLLPPKQ